MDSSLCKFPRKVQSCLRKRSWISRQKYSLEAGTIQRELSLSNTWVQQSPGRIPWRSILTSRSFIVYLSCQFAFVYSGTIMQVCEGDQEEEYPPHYWKRTDQGHWPDRSFSISAREWSPTRQHLFRDSCPLSYVHNYGFHSRWFSSFRI